MLALRYFEENGPVITVSGHRDPEGYEFTVSVSTGSSHSLRTESASNQWWM
jgi:hypothetical protein